MTALAIPVVATRLDRATSKMNGTERAYGEHLELQRRAGIVAWYRFQGITLLLGDDLRYTPDYVVVTDEGALELHEVKGFWRDDARVKIKAAAELFPFVFRAYSRRPKKDGGGWSVEEF